MSYVAIKGGAEAIRRSKRFFQEELQGTQRGNDDSQLGVTETRVILDQGERTKVQAGGQRDTVDAAIERGA